MVTDKGSRIPIYIRVGTILGDPLSILTQLNLLTHHNRSNLQMRRNIFQIRRVVSLLAGFRCRLVPFRETQRQTISNDDFLIYSTSFHHKTLPSDVKSSPQISSDQTKERRLGSQIRKHLNPLPPDDAPTASSTLLGYWIWGNAKVCKKTIPNGKAI